MNIGVLGTGGVGRTIGSKLTALGHTVKTGSRTASLGEEIQSAFPRARGVKTLNTVTASVMVNPLAIDLLLWVRLWQALGTANFNLKLVKGATMTVKTTRLGRTGLQVSRICLGTMNFGPFTSQADSFRIMDHAVEKGVQFFDTANVYGRSAGRGATETIVGNWFAQGAGRRDQVVLATKVYGRMGDGPNDARLSARHIRQACEESLKRLQTDHIDLYQMHHVDRHTPWEEIWQAMGQLIDAGKVLYVGTSNFAAWHIVKGNAAARAQGRLGTVSEQSIYHLNNRTVELEVLPMCQGEGIAVLPWSPLASGLLGGVLKKEADGRRGSDFVKERVEKFRPQLERYEALCDRLGLSPAVVGLAWLLQQPAVTAPIVGPRLLEHLESAIAATETSLDDETLRELDAIFPGPGGEAPEAYAW